MLKKRILVISDDFPPSFRGGDLLALKDFLLGLNKKKYNVTVFLPKSGNDYFFESIYVKKCSKIASRLYLPNGILISVLLFNLIFFIESIIELRKTNPDLIITCGRNVFIYGSLARILTGKKHLSNIHDGWPVCQFSFLLNYYHGGCNHNSRFCIKCHYSWSAKYYGIESKLVLFYCFLSYFQQKIRKFFLKRGVDGIFVPSSFLKNIILEQYENQDIHVIPNLFMEIKEKKCDIIVKEIDSILFLGKIGYEKGIFEFLKFVKYFPNKKVKIIGKGPLLTKLKTVFHQYEWMGYIKRDLIPNYLTPETIVFVPSIVPESFGRTMVESALLKAIVIVYRSGALEEYAEKLRVYSVNVFDLEKAIEIALNYIRHKPQIQYLFFTLNPIFITQKYNSYIDDVIE